MGLFSWLSNKGVSPSNAQSSGQMQPQSQEVIKAHLTKAWHDKQFQVRVTARIQKCVPSLGPELSAKACLGTIAKLVSAMLSGWSRQAWEKNVVDMLHNSPPMRFGQGEALAVCRLVENDIRRLFGWKIEIPDPDDHRTLEDRTVFVNEDTAGIVWLLSRGQERLGVIGGVLTTQLLTAMQEGWRAAAFEKPDASGRHSLNLGPCLISDQESAALGRVLRNLLAPPEDEESRMLLRQIELMLSFFEKGGFRIDRAPDSLALPSDENVLVWRL